MDTLDRSLPVMSTSSLDPSMLFDELESTMERLKLDHNRCADLLSRYLAMKYEYKDLDETRICLLAENVFLTAEYARIRNELTHINLNEPRNAHVWLALFESYARFSSEIVPRHVMERRVWTAAHDAWLAERRMLRAQISEIMACCQDVLKVTMDPLAHVLQQANGISEANLARVLHALDRLREIDEISEVQLRRYDEGQI